MTSRKSSFSGRLIAIVLAASAFVFSVPAFATREARPIQIDHRVRLIVYQPDAVYKYTGHYRYASQIEFGHDETIQTISMGDSTSWMLNPSGFRLFLKPIEQDATTNMTIITNKHTYLFELHARETDDIDDKDMTFIMRFVYPDEGQGQTLGNYLEAVPSPETDPDKYNLKYSISGTDVIAPIRIFDDGQFTFFQFRNKNSDIPAFFMVDDKGNEALINYRTRGDYIVVERVAKKFTLRHGDQVVCVFNDAWNPAPTPPPLSADKASGK